MSQAVTASKAKKTKVPVLVLELLDRRPSGYEKEGSRDAGAPIFLDAPSIQFILPRSVMIDPVTKEIVNLRYLKSGRDIFQEAQEKRNEQHNPQSDYIVFENGVLTVRREGNERNLYDFLSACSWNQNASNRYDEVQPIFCEINEEAAAEADMQDIEDFSDALQLATGMRTKKATGGSEYDEERIDALVALFNIQVEDSYPIKFQAIVSIATTRPTWFKKMVDDTTASVKIAIVQGRELGVISMDGDHASFIDSQRNFYKFIEKELEARILELSNYLISKKSAKDYKELVLKVNAAKELKLGLQ